MPPNEPTKKPKVAPDKVAADKTFGMKNKKGGAAQKQIKQIQQSAASSMTPEQRKKEAEKVQRERDKKAAEEAARETAELFKPAQVQKVPFGVDPKTVVCQFFKAGRCEKGKKCKFSHDLAVERKGEKRSLYTDTREGDETGNGTANGEQKEDDNMADWDEDKLRSVVLSKKGNQKTITDKVCKYFIDAVENGKYGWFWTCPNGGDQCKYKHSLPPGFVLKTKEQRAAEKALMDKSPLVTLTMEDFLESERQKLTGDLTPVTSETFAKWKKERLDKRAAEEQARAQKEATGRAMFERGDWADSEDDDDDENEDGTWNMEALRHETEIARQAKEEERIANQYGGGGAGGIENTLERVNGDGGQSGIDLMVNAADHSIEKHLEKQ